MQEENKNLDLIAVKIREKLEPIFTKMLTDYSQDIQHLGDLDELSSWYKKAGTEENVISAILQDTVNKTMEFVPQHFGTIVLDNVQINSKKTEMQFELNFQPDPVKSYVEFGIKVDNQKIHTEKFVFEINSDITLKDIEVKSDEKKKEICFGTLIINLHVLLSKVPFMKLNEPIDLGEKKFELDLSKLSHRF